MENDFVKNNGSKEFENAKTSINEGRSQLNFAENLLNSPNIEADLNAAYKTSETPSDQEALFEKSFTEQTDSTKRLQITAMQNIERGLEKYVALLRYENLPLFDQIKDEIKKTWNALESYEFITYEFPDQLKTRCTNALYIGP